MSRLKILPGAFFKRPALTVARELLGKILIHKTARGQLSGRIVETEAYGQRDPASHAFGGRTKRNSVMFGPAGRAYVYFTYGMHYCFNVVTDPAGTAGAVLIRALVPTRGIKIMQKKRQQKNIYALASGPAKLTQALGLTRKHNGLSVRGPEILIVANQPQKFKIRRTPRIGIRREKKPKLWRFYIKDSPFVSKI